MNYQDKIMDTVAKFAVETGKSMISLGLIGIGYSKYVISAHILSELNGVSIEDMRQGRVSEVQMKGLQATCDDLESSKIWVLDDENDKLTTLALSALHEMEKMNIDIVLIVRRPTQP